jgi:hypothetical protein
MILRRGWGFDAREGVTMADNLHVDLAALRIGSHHINGAADDAAVDFIVHEDGIADAAPGWIGESANALDKLLARWEVKHAGHKRNLAALNNGIITAGSAYAAKEETSAQALRSIDP